MPADPASARYSIGELAELTGVSRRTVHFYVQRRLIDPPLGRGRGRHYDERHVRQIRRVRELQRQGVPLQEMEAGLARGAEQCEVHDLPVTMPAVAWPGEVSPVLRIRVDENVTVEVAQTASPTPALIADLASAVSAIMNKHRGGGADRASTPSPGSGARQSEPEDEEES